MVATVSAVLLLALLTSGVAAADTTGTAESSRTGEVMHLIRGSYLRSCTERFRQLWMYVTFRYVSGAVLVAFKVSVSVSVVFAV